MEAAVKSTEETPHPQGDTADSFLQELLLACSESQAPQAAGVFWGPSDKAALSCSSELYVRTLHQSHLQEEQQNQGQTQAHLIFMKCLCF